MNTRRTFSAALLVVALAGAAGAGCSRQAAAEDVEAQVVESCYLAFFRAADATDATALRELVTAATRTRYESEEFPAGRLFASWKDVAHAYADAKTATSVASVQVEGTRAVVKDVVGARLRCQLEDGKWRVDLVGE